MGCTNKAVTSLHLQPSALTSTGFRSPHETLATWLSGSMVLMRLSFPDQGLIRIYNLIIHTRSKFQHDSDYFKTCLCHEISRHKTKVSRPSGNMRAM